MPSEGHGKRCGMGARWELNKSNSINPQFQLVHRPIQIRWSAGGIEWDTFDKGIREMQCNRNGIHRHEHHPDPTMHIMTIIMSYDRLIAIIATGT